MGSGLGFQSENKKEKIGMPRKKTVSRGLIVVFALLILVILAYVGLNMYKNKLDAQAQMLKDETIKTQKDISTTLSDDTADFVVRSATLDKELYRGYDSNAVLGEIEKIMILKESDQSGNRTVLKSFQYNSGSKTKKVFNDGEATITGSGSVTITADADTFDVMAQQIDAFKNNTMFDNVQVGSTDRDDSGRIIFTLTMDVVGSEQSPYETGNTTTQVMTQPITQEPEVELEIGSVEADMEGAADGPDTVINIVNDVDGDITVTGENPDDNM